MLALGKPFSRQTLAGRRYSHEWCIAYVYSQLNPWLYWYMTDSLRYRTLRLAFIAAPARKRRLGTRRYPVPVRWSLQRVGGHAPLWERALTYRVRDNLALTSLSPREAVLDVIVDDMTRGWG